MSDRPAPLSAALSHSAGGGMTLMTPSFGPGVSEHHSDGEDSVHTNSTGDDGAADAAASAVLDLSLIRRGGRSSPASPLVGKDDDGAATGDNTPSDKTDPGCDSPSHGLSPMDQSGLMGGRLASRRLSSHSGAGATSPRGLNKRAGTSLRVQNSRRCLSPSGVRSPPKRQPSYRGKVYTDGLPSDCVASPMGSPSSLPSAAVPASPPRSPDPPDAEIKIQPLEGEEEEKTNSPGRARRETVAAANRP
eukprot:Hpha_TRINITY_DN14975_c0_g1::TRINITY_DN14975_c0_g1_i1::g.142869::m.142869